MHPETISAETRAVLDKIGKSGVASNFYLAGGTALAVHLGHRISVDLDFFADKPFSTDEIKSELTKLGKLTVTQEDKGGTLNGILDGVQVSFFIYRYPNKYPVVKFDDISLADERDIAAMKLDAISSRGVKKDFIDLFFLLRKYSLAEIMGFFEARFSEVQYNKLHLLKSLTYFADAEDNPDPIMLAKVSWDEVKKEITNEVKKIF